MEGAERYLDYKNLEVEESFLSCALDGGGANGNGNFGVNGCFHDVREGSNHQITILNFIYEIFWLKRKKKAKVCRYAVW